MTHYDPTYLNNNVYIPMVSFCGASFTHKSRRWKWLLKDQNKCLEF